MSVAVRNFTHGTLKIKGGGSGEELTVPLEEGNVRFSVVKNAKVIKSRGAVQGLAEGVEEALTVSFGFHFQEWQGKSTSGANPSPVDALKKQGNASSWTSVANCGPYQVDLEFVISNPCATGDQTETLTFPKFHADSAEFEEGEESNMINVSGTCGVHKPTSARS